VFVSGIVQKGPVASKPKFSWYESTWLSRLVFSNKLQSRPNTITQLIVTLQSFWNWDDLLHKTTTQFIIKFPSYSTFPSYNWLRIGHTRLTHSYLIEHTDPPKCTHCNHLLSVTHILTECTSWSNTTSVLFLYGQNIFNHTPSQNILNFI